MEKLNFAYVTDTHLADGSEQVAKNISSADIDMNFSCLVYGGNALNGNNPEKISMKLLDMEYNKFKNSLKSNVLLPVQGEKDGWRDERFKGQLAMNIMTDKVWSENIAFVNKYKGINKQEDAPYYFIDFNENKVRFIILCSYFYEYDEECELFEKFKGFKAKQLKWLIKEALNVPEGFKVVIFSHTVPKSRFETGKDPFIYNSWSTEQNLMIFQQAQKLKGVKIAAWISGGYKKEETANIGGIYFVCLKNLCAYSCSLGETLNIKNLTENTSYDIG